MKLSIAACLVLAQLLPGFVRAEEEPSPEIAGLQQAASNFVTAFNKKDAAALAALFTEAGEISDLKAEDLTTGRAEIQAHYQDIFDDDEVPSIAIEVDSVRLVAPNLAIEDGTVHLTPPGENAPPRSTDYTAVLTKGEGGAWLIASTRSLRDATDAAGQLADLAKVLKGDWTAQKESVRLDLAFGWDESGKFLSAEMLTTTPEAEPQPGTMRIGWDAAKKSIVSWIFDSKGGVAQGTWTPTDDGWLIRTEGTTGDGEAMSASQKLKPVNKDTLLWSVTDCVVDGEVQPDSELRVVRQTPEPAPN